MKPFFFCVLFNLFTLSCYVYTAAVGNFMHTVNRIFSLWLAYIKLYKKNRNFCNMQSYVVHLFPVAPILRHRASVKYLFHFSFLILRQSVGLLGLGISPSQGRYIRRTTQRQNTQTYMPWMGFEHTIPVFERGKTIHALDRAATLMGTRYSCRG
jgi:hypothetical protein